ncbi:MAG: thiol-disulfide isomerase/thioredoxin [Bacteriovoracaceae bacterium]|jgi:thiol-disulfide isomerase/thioredoxin
MKKLLCLFFLFSLSAFSGEVKDFKLTTYKDKKEFRLKDHLGKKTIVLNFWASWCTSCITELPELHALKKKYPEALFIGVNSGETEKFVKKFLRRYKFNYEILMDKTKSVAKSYGIDTLPRTIVINKNRKITYKGDRPPAKL